MMVRYTTPDLDRSVDRIFRQMTADWFDRGRTLGPVVHGSWGEDDYTLTVDLPGIPAGDVSVEVAGRTLTISASHDGAEWQRSLKLPNRLDPEQVTGNHVAGRLTIRIGVVASPEARSIEISTEAPAIEASSTVDETADGDDQTATSSNA